MVAIEKKLMDNAPKECSYSLSNWSELIIFVVLIVMLAVMLTSASQSFNTLGFVVTQKQAPVAQSELMRNRIILEQ
jgi:hypothetical protein